jgi:hypothetical protein
MSMIILPEAKKDEWCFENGKEVLWYDENRATNHVILTSPMHPRRIGYVRSKTSDAKQMDRVFRRLHEQEREKNEAVIEKMWGRGRERYEQARSTLNQRLQGAGTSEWEKSFIREALRLMAERDHEAQKNTRYGVSGMELEEAPIPGGRTLVN